MNTTNKLKIIRAIIEEELEGNVDKVLLGVNGFLPNTERIVIQPIKDIPNNKNNLGITDIIVNRIKEEINYTKDLEVLIVIEDETFKKFSGKLIPR